MDKQVLVAMVNYKQNSFTIDCVKSVSDCGVAPESIVVFDNGNKPKDHEELKASVSSMARVLYSEKNVGYIGGVNECLALGLRENYSYILIMNNDTVIDTDAVGELISCALRYQDRCIVTGIVYDYTERNLIQTIGSDLVDKKRLKFVSRIRSEYDCGQLTEEIEFDMIDDIFWLVPMELVRQIGFYNNAFWFNAEQADFALRAKKAGYKLIFTPRAKLWHKGSASVGGREENPVITYWNTQSRLILKRIHLPLMCFLRDIVVSLCFALLKGMALYRMADKQKRRVARVNNRAVILASLYVIGWCFTRKANKGFNPFLERA